MIHVIGVQKQYGGDDCGLFAISMAFDLCCGIDPFTQIVNQDQMRDHLLSCFEEEVITPFPKVPRKNIAKMKRIIKSVSFKLFCVCRGPEYGLMVQCNHCQEWFHPVCVHIPNEVLLNENLPWLCYSCEFPVYSCMYTYVRTHICVHT